MITGNENSKETSDGYLVPELIDWHLPLGGPVGADTLDIMASRYWGEGSIELTLPDTQIADGDSSPAERNYLIKGEVSV